LGRIHGRPCVRYCAKESEEKRAALPPPPAWNKYMWDYGKLDKGTPKNGLDFDVATAKAHFLGFKVHKTPVTLL
jgi:hypothetical protein